jgi:hypothetical protein
MKTDATIGATHANKQPDTTSRPRLLGEPSNRRGEHDRQNGDDRPQ